MRLNIPNPPYLNAAGSLLVVLAVILIFVYLAYQQ